MSGESTLICAAQQAADPQTALLAWKRALDAEPENPEAILGYADALLQNQAFDDAIALLETGFPALQSSAPALVLLGEACCGAARYIEAVEIFARACQLEPKSAVLYNNLCVACLAAKRLDEALSAGRQAVQLDPDSAEAQFNLGVAYREKFQSGSHVPPDDLARWLPVSIMFRRESPFVEWQYSGDKELDDPFFYQTEERLTREFAPFPRLQTDFETLQAFGERSDANRPDGLIFHLGRCGSTVLSNALRAVPGTVSLSEPGVIAALLWPYAAEIWPCSLEEWERALPGLLAGCVAAYRQKRRGDEQRLFIKFTSRVVLSLPTLQTIWPEVPRLFLYRDPVEVVASYLADPGPWLQNRNAPAQLVGMRPDELARLSMEEYLCLHLGHFCRAAAQAAQTGTRLFNYSELDLETVLSLFRLFGIGEDEPDSARLLAAMTTYAKDTQRAARFTPDSQAKRRALSSYARKMVQKYVEEPYALLESLRLSQRAGPYGRR